jgi:hypothetical protein
MTPTETASHELVEASRSTRIAAANRGKIVTTFWMKPIPMRQFDWCATFANDEPNDNGQMLHGTGATEEEAIEELLTNYEDGL